MPRTFDYIVLGAGSAGCALVNRLGANPGKRVLLLEAGGHDRNPWLHIPLGVGQVFSSDRYSWNLETAPEPNMNDRRIVWHHGRVIGGSSSINGMLVVRGEPARYDEWGRSGSPGWSHRELLPYLKRLEDCPFGDPAVRGRGGPIPIHLLETDDPLSAAFIESCMAAGLPFNEDYNDGRCEGVSRNQLNTRNGRRWSTASAYLKPALKRGNLTLECEALVRRILIEDLRAVGVEYEVDGQLRVARTAGEVIVSCGALHSPQVLEHSGIGDERHLRGVGIQPVHHLPGVGENLRDHLHARIQYETTEAVTGNDVLRSRWIAARELTRYLLRRRGLFRTPTLKVTAFMRSPHAREIPDVRLQLGLSSGVTRSIKDGLDPFPGFNLGGYQLYPRASGSVHVTCADPREPPRMLANYLGAEEDRSVNVWAMHFCRTLASMPSLARLIVRETRPGPQVASDAEMLEFIKDTAQTSWHPVGTCKMGDDPMAVVDADLRVRGLSALRVADASVMPFHVASNTNIPSIMVGEKAADLVLGNRR
jgi:choline dehydrogenase